MHGCAWKDDASHYNVEAGDEHLEDAAWYSNDATNNIKDHVTLYDSRLRGVEG